MKLYRSWGRLRGQQNVCPEKASVSGRKTGRFAGGELRQRPPNLNLELIGILVLHAATVFPCARRSSPSGGPNQVWREATAHQRVGRRAKTAVARSRAPSRCVAPFFASSVGSLPRRSCGRSRSERHGCPHSRRIHTAPIDDFFCPSFKGWSATK